MMSGRWDGLALAFGIDLLLCHPIWVRAVNEQAACATLT